MIITNLEDIKKYQGVIAPELYGHPQFMRELDYALKWYKEECGPVFLNLEVFDDGKKIIISHQFVSNRVNPELTKNNRLLSFSFAVGEKGGLSVETSSGVCYDKDQFVEVTSKDFVDGRVVYNPEKREKMTKLYNGYDSILSTFYKNTFYNADGVQMSVTHFSDLYPLTGHRYNDDLVQQVLTDLHRPKKWIHNLGPTMPDFVSNGKYTHMYRYETDLGVVHKMERSGIKMVNYASYEIDTKRDTWEILHGEYPEYLMTVSGYPIAEPKKDPARQFDYVGLDEFVGLTGGEVKAKVSEYFLSMVDNSKTRSLNPNMYEKLREYALASVKRYNPEFMESVSHTM